MAATASRPAGLQKRRYAKLPTLKRARQPPALPSRFASYVQSAVRPCGVLALGAQSGAARIVVVSGFAVYLVFAPAHPWGLLASQLRPRGLPVRPPRGLPQPARFVIGFPTNLEASQARYTGATGLTACKPA